MITNYILDASVSCKDHAMSFKIDFHPIYGTLSWLNFHCPTSDYIFNVVSSENAFYKLPAAICLLKLTNVMKQKIPENQQSTQFNQILEGLDLLLCYLQYTLAD